MASNTSKTARASVRAGAGTGGALSVLGEYKYVIPLNHGRHAYVRNLTNGKTLHLRTDSDAVKCFSICGVCGMVPSFSDCVRWGPIAILSETRRSLPLALR